MSYNLLITGAGGASGVYSIKILKETTDHYIVGVDASPYSPGLFLADEGYVFPLAGDEDAFLNAVRDVVLSKRIDVIIPNVDEELPLLARPDVQATLGAKVIVSPLETILTCVNKARTVQALKDVIPCPKTMTADGDLSNLSYPVHLKPVDGRGSRHTYLIEDQAALKECIRQVEDCLGGRHKLLIQEYLPGKEYTVDALFDLSGQPLAIIPRVRLRVSSGLSVQGQTVRNEVLIENVRAIAKRLTFHGPINLQFREDAEGVPKILEINPRFSGGLPIVTAAGANTPAWLLEIVQGLHLDPQALQASWHEGIVLRYLEEFFIPLDEWNARFGDQMKQEGRRR